MHISDSTKSNDDCPVKLTVILMISLSETNIPFFWNDLRVKGKGKARLGARARYRTIGKEAGKIEKKR